MSRIEPIAASKALVRFTRDGERANARRTAEAGPDRRRRRPFTAALAHTALGDAAAEAAFEIHRLSKGSARGLKADLGVRRLWTDAYATAAKRPVSPPVECARA